MIFEYTGNPFTDSGMWALAEFAGKSRPEDVAEEDIKRVINESGKSIVDVYTSDPWIKTLYSVFPNNSITNNRIKDKETSLRDYLNSLCDSIEPAGETGNCISCGRRNTQELRLRKDIPLIGSGKFINYFPMGQEGGDYCPACTLAIQFVPIVLYDCGNKIMVHSNSYNIMKYWTKKALGDLYTQMATEYTGCFDEGYKNPTNALFHIIESIIRDYDELWQDENPSITLYHFTNYSQGPDLDIYYFPTPVFRFLAYIKQHDEFQEWRKIVRRGYFKTKSKNLQNITNSVYTRLLNNQSILDYFINTYNKTEYKIDSEIWKIPKIYGNWDLLSYYLIEVINMSEKRLETIKKVGDGISDYIMKTNDVKRINQLDNAVNFNSFKNQLKFIEKRRIENAIKDSLFTLDEYAEDLFPEGALSWKETRDMLLFRIYENLHNQLIEKGELISTDEEDEEMYGNNENLNEDDQ